MRAVLLALVVSALPSVARAAPMIDVYTMGVGDELFSAFGHAAICVTDGEAPRGRCYNYGTADFTTPVPLTWNFIRGRALFWVSTTDVPHMLHYYASVGRAVWRQTLLLTSDEATRVAVALDASAQEGTKYYRYHHFNDNCTTRIRDVLDRATFGRLSKERIDRKKSFREWAREGFAGDVPMLVVNDLLLGRPADRRTDSWQAMFLPSELRAEMERRFGARPILVVAGQPRPPLGRTWLGLAAFAIAGAILALLVLVNLRLGRALVAIKLGTIGIILWLLAVLSTFPELTRNELLLSFWPTDVALPWLGRRYLNVRLIVLGLVIVGHLGLLVQPLAPTLLALLPMLALRFATRTSSRPG
ncbi:MAG: lipoprotein N-acyltransferase Lnb domain-containing protein [Polyangia bacterium]